jgi:hypothetical protein
LGRPAPDPVIQSLLASGELAAEHLRDATGRSSGGGQLLADELARAVRADRSVHPRRFLLGPSVSGSAGSAGFSRPGFNGAGLRQNDAVARHILRELAEPRPVPPASDRPTLSHARSHPRRLENHHAR